MRGDILVVDDEAGPRESLRMILKPDHDVRIACNGQEALDEIEKRKPDLIFLDLKMPGMDGTEVLRLAKERHPDVAVAIMTAYAGVESARLAVRLGAVDYLMKPYSVADVERVVTEVLSARRQEHDARVLADQVASMANSLSARAGAWDKAAASSVAEAADSLKSLHETVGDDLASVQELCELGEVTAEVSHDINNFLTVILASSEFVLTQLESGRECPPETLNRRVSAIMRAAGDCTAMVQRIKSYVRAEVDEEHGLVQLNNVVSSAVDMAREKAAARGTRVGFVTHLNDVPPVPGDETALKNVLVNLVENSLDAMPEGGTVELRTLVSDEKVRIQVCDTGAGMSADVLAKATKAFYSTKQSRGTGLGLSVVNKIVRGHQGQLSITSAVGVGTTVTIELPVALTVTEFEEEGCQPDEDSRKPTVIVADDQDAMRDIISNVLQAEGYDTLCAADGTEAWRLFQDVHPTMPPGALVVVADHEMPGILGLDLAELVKEADADTPVMIVTGYSVPATQAVDALMHKPFGTQDLVDNVGRLMRHGCEPERMMAATG